MNPTVNDDVPQTYLLLFTVLPEAIIETMLAPLVPFLIRSLSADVPADQLEAAIGGRSGLFAGMFYLPLLFTSIIWGTLSDILGRKPILLIGLLFSGITTFVLGINNSSFAIALLCRFFAGVFGSNSIVAKGALGEIHTDEKGRSWAYSAYGSLYAISGIMGPLIGGLLVDSNAVKDISDVKKSYPYFNACLFGTVLTAVSIPITIQYFHEPKFLKRRHSKVDSTLTEAVENESILINGETLDNETQHRALSTHFRELFSISGMARLYTSLCEPMTAKSMFPISLYVLIAFCNMSWSVLLPLLFATSPNLGGLGFTPFDSSFAMTLAAISKLFFQTLFCERIVLGVGPNGAYRVGMAVVIPASVFVGILGGSFGGSGVSWWITMICMIMFGFVEAIAYLSSILMISDSVPASSLGAAHGLAATCAALVRTIAPTLSGYVWEFASVRVNKPWFAFVIVEIVAAFAVFVAWKGSVSVTRREYMSLENDIELHLTQSISI
ncbi:hypothetical protein HK100_012571 [Physocladia obscura]|uniref:Major facilitator superfamily (MFS) profile domain-containing protein n=1 Tax=Physocladia obscura TaxID=109957 RepID=A0AAD5TAP7_9FUNG|nr:hypothetical protein HK100_012571 [Physocladia obscura]